MNSIVRALTIQPQGSEAGAGNIAARKFILSSFTVLSFSTLLVTASYFHGSKSAQVAVYGFSILYIIYAFAFDDEQVKRFLLFGLCIGFTELLADAWAVLYTKTLIYPTDQPIIWASPLYMPFAWMMVFIKVGYFGFKLGQKQKLLMASIIMFFIGGTLVPLTEFLSIKSGWWGYQNVHKFLTIPYYVIFTEGFTMSCSPWFFLKCEKAPWKLIPLLGVFQALVILISLWISFYLFR